MAQEAPSLTNTRDRLLYDYLLLHIIDGGGHGAVLGLGEEEGEDAGGDGHHAKDQGGDDGADLGQRGHGGRQGASHLKGQIEKELLRGSNL